MPNRDLIRKAWISAGAPVFGLALIFFIAAACVLLHFARREDQHFATNSTNLVASAFDARRRALSDITVDYAYWNDAYDAITNQWRSAWLEDNFYSTVADGMVVARADGRAVYAHWRPAAQAQSAAITRAILAELPRLDQAALVGLSANSDASSSFVITTANGLALVSVAPIRPEAHEARIRSKVDSFLISVAILDADAIGAIGRQLHLDAFAITPEPPSANLAFALPGVSAEPAGYISWRRETPGTSALAGEIVALVVLLIALAAATAFVTRRLAHQQMQAAIRIEAALDANRLKSEFLTAISHELRTPLNAIIGYTELIQETVSPANADGETITEDAGQVLIAARHLNHFVTDLLDQARLDAGRLNLPLERVSLADLFSDLAGIMAGRAAQRDVQLDIQTKSELLAHANFARTAQCLRTLTTHALAHATSRVTVSASRPRTGKISIEIWSDGLPHSEAELKRLFEPFQHGDVPFGATPGMPLAAGLARAMRGALTASSAPDGTVLRLELESDCAILAREAAMPPTQPWRASQAAMTAAT